MKFVVIYLAILLTLGSAIWFTLDMGSTLRPDAQAVVVSGENPSGNTSATLTDVTRIQLENLKQPVGIFLSQIVVIVALARLFGNMCAKFGQPRVIGEMLAGIVLGPSVLGFMFPGLMGFLFPTSSMQALQLISQFGVILYMFIVGMDVDLGQLRHKAHTAMAVSHASILLPFLLGTLLSLAIYRSMAPADVSFTAFALFIGVAMSITAFPVLARIVEERRLTHTVVGKMAISCAAVDDVTAWCILAVVLAIAKAGGLISSATTLILLIMYVAVMFYLFRPLLSRLGTRLETQPATPGSDHFPMAVGIALFALFAGLTTEIIGVHALFGAFLAGAVVPVGKLRISCKQRFESLTAGLLLPLFFAYSGLRTQINLLNDSSSWLICLAVIGCAVLGKLGASTVAARWTGLNWRDSFALGALMNTRGLMELIVLNIGYDLGILSSELFAIFTLMALATTFMTAPLLSIIHRKSEEFDRDCLSHSAVAAQADVSATTRPLKLV